MADPKAELDLAIKELRDLPVATFAAVSSEALDIIGKEYVAEFQLAIREKRSPGGKAHADLMPRSKYPRKSGRNPSNHVLIDKGGLLGSFSHEKRPSEVEIGTDLDKAISFQRGTSIMVPRVIVEVSPTANKAIRRRLSAGGLFGGEAAQALSDAIGEALDGASED